MSHLYMFVGDSHSRQFQMDTSGQVSFTSFSGATLKGLGTELSRRAHHRTVLDLAAVRRWKTLYVMFGGVDLDATWFRKLTVEGDVDEERFFRERSEALDVFLTKLLAANSLRVLKEVCVLLPQAPGLRDEKFCASTAAMARIEPTELKAAMERHDTGHLSRCRRTIAFNDWIEARLPRHDRTTLYRIDRQMVDARGMLLDRFMPVDVRDHHPNQAQTLPLWTETLQETMPVLRKQHLRNVERVRRRQEAAEAALNPAAGAEAS